MNRMPGGQEIDGLWFTVNGSRLEFKGYRLENI